MDVELFGLFLLVVFKDVFTYTAALIVGFSMAFQFFSAIAKALSPDESSQKGGD